MKNYIAPNPSIKSFTCPHCGSYSLHENLPIINNRPDRNVYLRNLMQKKNHLKIGKLPDILILGSHCMFLHLFQIC